MIGTNINAKTGLLIRWDHHLCPDIVKSKWSEEDCKKLLEEFEVNGCQWKKISESFPHRSHISVKNRFFSLVRKILRRLNKLQGRLFDQKSLTVIKPKILHEIFSISIRFSLVEGEDVVVSVKEIFMAYFTNFRSLFENLDFKVKREILKNFLKVVLVLDENYRNFEGKKMRKERFIK